MKLGTSNNIPENGKEWGRWRYDKKNVRLSCATGVGPRGSYRYSVDFTRFDDSTEIVALLAHVAGKDWATAEDVGYLFAALNELAGGLMSQVHHPPIDFQGRLSGAARKMQR